MNNEKLVSVNLKEDKGKYYLFLQYQYDDGINIHEFVIPRVLLPITNHIPYISEEGSMNSYTPTTRYIRMFGNEYIVEPTKINGIDNCSAFDKIIGSLPAKEMTIKEIEEKLGYRVKIVGGEN